MHNNIYKYQRPLGLMSWESRDFSQRKNLQEKKSPRRPCRFCRKPFKVEPACKLRKSKHSNQENYKIKFENVASYSRMWNACTNVLFSNACFCICVTLWHTKIMFEWKARVAVMQYVQNAQFSTRCSPVFWQKDILGSHGHRYMHLKLRNNFTYPKPVVILFYAF